MTIRQIDDDSARKVGRAETAFTGSPLGRKDNGLPTNYAIEISLLKVELNNEVGRLLDVLGEDRVLFGTGMPFHYPGPSLAKLQILEAPARVKEKIRRGNAVRWLGL